MNSTRVSSRRRSTSSNSSSKKSYTVKCLSNTGIVSDEVYADSALDAANNMLISMGADFRAKKLELGSTATMEVVNTGGTRRIPTYFAYNNTNVKKFSFSSPKLMTSSGIPCSLSNICKDVVELEDAVASATAVDELVYNINKVKLKYIPKFKLHSNNGQIIRLINQDKLGNTSYLTVSINR